MDAPTELKDLVSMAVCGLCDSPMGVQITATIPNPKEIFLSIVCPPEEIRRVVGREGRNINALRVLAAAWSAKNKLRSTLVIYE